MLSRIKAILKDFGYILYTKPYELNIVGIRSKSVIPNRFDDEIHIFYQTKEGKWNYHMYSITTDPGTYWLKNPSYTQGTAILSDNQYVNAYALGMHRGKYEALVQVKPVTVIRDYDRDAVLDFNNGVKDTGLFGINIHRAESTGATPTIDKYSAGCQVFQNVEHFNLFIGLCEQHAKLYGNSFTYTLVDFRALARVTLKRILIVTSLAVTTVASWIAVKVIKNILSGD